MPSAKRAALLWVLALLGACAPAPPALVSAPPPAAPPAGMQYLYGSGEGAALSAQAWNALLAYVSAKVKARPADSVVLAEGAALEAPHFVPCGEKPFAAIFDVDETVMLNLGFEYHDATTGKGYDAADWDAWERTGEGAVVPVPGADGGIAALRKMGVTVVFNTNRSTANADATARAIAAAGLGAAVHGQTLFLNGDDAMGSHKDGRRATIASRYCVIAMGGDQLGDFSDLFNAGQAVPARRAATMRPAVAAMWGKGWFILPNPVYGSGLKGGFDDVFPMDKRWAPPADGEK
ncbi:5'-nucleotidase (lipoprotein e(P4) family) [Sphingobium sp. OAS761]|uniref:HAD family acid phosphatase n=1 Tax=Sphingobium sp. OAS761 TaxID=2817901 RepID=UPI0020A1EEAD|nr:HAD family acid phosphatase [Sphingobium sp. OAS761]MCP1468488.1 5'-nucleotidase (lipoprotein e(P4) family) [Sphingobium sp. OAS761]